MLSRLGGTDRDQDQEFTSVRDTLTFTMNASEVELLIRSTQCFFLQFFSEEFNKKNIITERSIMTEERSIIIQESILTGKSTIQRESIVTEGSIII